MLNSSTGGGGVCGVLITSWFSFFMIYGLIGWHKDKIISLDKKIKCENNLIFNVWVSRSRIWSGYNQD